MSDLKELLDREARRVDEAPDALGSVLRRRDRKRGNQRIAAGVVGIGVFVAAVWIVSGVASLDRGDTTVVPAGSGTTGPAETGPALTTRPTGDYVWLPPEGVEPSTPARGTVIREEDGIHPWRYTQVYADGRVIWFAQTGYTGNTTTAPTIGWLERRLTPEGIHLLRSGEVSVGPPWLLPATAWEDTEVEWYVPSRYVVCGDWHETFPLLPQRTQDLLQGYTSDEAVTRGEVDYGAGGRGVACPAVTIEEARALDETFREVGFERSETAGGLVYDIPDVASIGLIPLLPDGSFHQCCPG
jgi:hypothetical protein